MYIQQLLRDVAKRTNNDTLLQISELPELLLLRYDWHNIEQWEPDALYGIWLKLSDDKWAIEDFSEIDMLALEWSTLALKLLKMHTAISKLTRHTMIKHTNLRGSTELVKAVGHNDVIAFAHCIWLGFFEEFQIELYTGLSHTNGIIPKVGHIREPDKLFDALGQMYIWSSIKDVLLADEDWYIPVHMWEDEVTAALEQQDKWIEIVYRRLVELHNRPRFRWLNLSKTVYNVTFTLSINVKGIDSATEYAQSPTGAIHEHKFAHRKSDPQQFDTIYSYLHYMATTIVQCGYPLINNAL